MSLKTPSINVVGIDVGGLKKGFHAVALHGGDYRDRITTNDITELVEWCVQGNQAQMIAVDAPCRWSTDKDGRCRLAERELMKKENKIWCFATPRRQRAINHPKNHFAWMLRGEALYEALKPTHPLPDNIPQPGKNCCFETYPHAITWHLRGGNADAKQKRSQRGSLLREASIDFREEVGIDFIDAALCALTAHLAASGKSLVSYGSPEPGRIFVPARTIS